MGTSGRRERRAEPRPVPATVPQAVTAAGAAASPLPVVLVLLFASGACALSFQVAWLRLLRLVFGNSTAASAAVLAIFMGGLGIGAVVLGRRADRHPNPLRLYAMLEAGIAVSAAATPFLVDAVRALYTATGGSAGLGLTLATVLRLLFSVAVLGLPTFFMGGTLPAAARSVERSGGQRAATAALYGFNTLGAVTGAALANFVLLEALGTRSMLFAAAALNATVAAVAFACSRGRRVGTGADDDATVGGVDDTTVRFALATAAVSGFAFLLLELVWYRMLAPMLGGSTYTFGIILAAALLGIGIGSLVFALEPPSPRRATLARLAFTTALQGACAILPFALGDRLELLAISLQALGAAGFGGLVFFWSVMAGIVVLPVAVVSGYQFPLLIALARSRDDRVASDVGRVYGFNTAGSIAGSIAGGFGMLPLLGAPGAWRSASAALLLTALAGALLQARRRGALFATLPTLAVCAAAVALCCSLGPTAVWRHTPTGAGLTPVLGNSPHDLNRFLYDTRRSVLWEEDGVESSVAVTDIDGASLFVNGKSDGNAIGDAATTVMLPMIPAMFHPAPKTALVVGLGLGVSAGWLAQVPSIERVDVVELEPAVLRAADDAKSANFDLRKNPKVHIVIGDAREFLLTTDQRYDIIVSEPSNPYRAGVASLFTTEYYEAARRVLREGGAFAQWLQAYAVSPSTFRSVLATLGSAFDSIEIWEVQLGVDALLLAREHDIEHDVVALESRLAAEPFRSALALSWGLEGVEGLYTGFLAAPKLARSVHATTPPSRRNTDDSPLIEFEFARSVRSADTGILAGIRRYASGDPGFAPFLRGRPVDWSLVQEKRQARAIHEQKKFSADEFRGSDAAMARTRARSSYAAGRPAEAVAAWEEQQSPPSDPMDLVLLADAMARSGDARAAGLAERLRSWSPRDAEAVLAQLSEQSGDPEAAAEHLLRCFGAARESVRGYLPVLFRAIGTAWEVARAQPSSVPALIDALGQPFAARAAEDRRVFARASIALQLGPPADCAKALEPVEPWVLYDGELLRQRVKCYERVASPLLRIAQRDLSRYESEEPEALFPAPAR